MSGEVLEERTEPKTTTEILPNLDAIRDATRTDSNYQTESKSYKNFRYEHDASLAMNWK